MFNNIYNNRRVLISGHTGFKGSWLTIWLNKLGAKVIGYALEPPTNPSLFEVCNLTQKITSNIGDIRDLTTLREMCKQYQPEIVFHLAAQALVRCSYKEPVATYATNVMGTVNILEACRHTSSVGVVVIVTSDKCYENCEWVWGYREIDSMGGDDPYSSSKGCAELVVKAYLKSFFSSKQNQHPGIKLVSVRAGNVIGGGDWSEDRLIPDCIKALIEKKPPVIRYPEAIRPWQHVLDPLYGYLLLAQRLYQSGSAFNGAWNFGPEDNDARPVKWLAEFITEMWGSNISWICDQGEPPHEAHYLKLDSSKAKSKLGWHPQWDLEVALKKTIEWYKAYLRREDMVDVTRNQIKEYEKKIQSLLKT